MKINTAVPLPANFQQQLAEKSDADLYDMLAHPDDYLPEAIDAARKEIEKRNLPAERTAQLQSASATQKSREDEQAARGLPLYVKLLLFCGLFPFLYFFAAYNESRGLKERSRQCWAWAGYGLVFWVIAGFLLRLLG
jgi:hypothetical protein